MATGKITISAIAKLQGWLWDTTVMGFGARRQTNLVHYYVRYRHNGQQIVRSIGRHGALTPDTARARAKQLLGTVAGGTDPFAQALSGEGFATSVDRYLERKRSTLKPNSFRQSERYLRNHSAPLHSLRLAQIDRRKVAALLGEIETSAGPASRNRLRSALSAFFSWCLTEGLLDANPVWQAQPRPTRAAHESASLRGMNCERCGMPLMMGHSQRWFACSCSPANAAMRSASCNGMRLI